MILLKWIFVGTILKQKKCLKANKLLILKVDTGIDVRIVSELQRVLNQKIYR
jgi:tRNA-binding EMAP/Myf-like protein